MLFILYGATSNMAYTSMEYFEKRGMNVVEKYNYAPKNPQLHSIRKEREYVSLETFLENTDSLFRYELGGIRYGFNQAQISNAVCDKTNSLLLVAAANIDFIAEIKRVYENHVRLIYSHIDDATLEEIIRNRPNITEEEVQIRLSIGKGVKNNYARHCHLFDHVVVYSGENSAFDSKNLCQQYEAIFQSLRIDGEQKKHYADVFLSYSHADKPLCQSLVYALQNAGISTFYDLDITAGENWKLQINDAIQHAKLFIPVLTLHAVKSQAVLAEIEFAFQTAENNGTLILPFVCDERELSSLPSYERLSKFQGVQASGRAVEGAIKELVEKIQTLFSLGDKLKGLSTQIESYLDLAMYEPALRLQREHVALCESAYELSQGQYVTEETRLTSRIKLIHLLLESQAYAEGLEYSVASLQLPLQDEKLFDALADQFAHCCVAYGFDEAQFDVLLRERLDGAISKERAEKLFDRFRDILVKRQGGDASADDAVEGEKAGKIALHSETIMTIFEQLLQSERHAASAQDLIVGYERLLNYCKYVGLRGEIADTCITRIAQLKAVETERVVENAAYGEALKIYLGQTQNKPGEYDVFISYKSQDEALAQKLYDYLTQAGKDVFFSKESLARLGQSEYEEMIFAAIEQSKHMVVVASNPDYLKTPWVKEEWDTFNNEIREGRKQGNVLLVLTDDIAADKGRLPIQLRQKEIIKMSEYKTRLISYLK